LNAAVHGVIRTAPAKINLVLRVGARGDGGYHEIVSLAARIDLADTLMVAAAARTSVTCPDLPGGDTLVTRALHEFCHATHRHGGFHVGIAKRIPVAAGLGGGSSDAAAALRAANELSGDPLDDADLAAIAAGIGSDVPFFLGGPVAEMRGRGELCTTAPPLPAAVFVVAHPGRPLATRDVYDAYQPTRPLVRELVSPTTISDLAAIIENDLAAVAEALEPACRTLREALVARGALAATVSGSGSAVFGVFADAAAAESAVVGLPSAAWARTATLSVV
jgi:4-diphosphocytidyl-2-C-methyl-D-erythritol kinase